MAYAWSKPNRIGIALTELLGLLNVALGLTFRNAPDGPPHGIAVSIVVLGAVMVVAGGVAWFSGSRLAATIASVANILQGITTLPAFLAAALVWKVVAAGILAWTVISVALTLKKPRDETPV
jgi:hypothetical protein